jgi:outer membrane protein OmpA-like peptidoglycan-associated protein
MEDDMNIGSKLMMATAIASLGITSACMTDPVTGERRISKAAIGGIGGAVGGYLLGDLVGGRRDRTEKILGAGIGGLAGAGIGAYMDRQERDLRERTRGTDIDVVRQGDDLILNMPSSVTFAYDSASVQPQYRGTLDQVADVLANYEQTSVDVYGHTDSTGSDGYNQGLSERRAASVADYLSTRGVRRERLATRGFGETQPIASNETEDGRAANRRVEIKLVPITQEDTARY